MQEQGTKILTLTKFFHLFLHLKIPHKMATDVEKLPSETVTKPFYLNFSSFLWFK